MWEYLRALLPRKKWIYREEPCEIRIVERMIVEEHDASTPLRVLEVAVLGPPEASVPLRLVGWHDKVWRTRCRLGSSVGVWTALPLHWPGRRTSQTERAGESLASVVALTFMKLRTQTMSLADVR